MNSSKPQWWELYISIPIMFATLLVLSGLHMPEWLTILADVGVVVGTFWYMTAWMRANEGVIVRAEFEEERQARAKLWQSMFAPRSRFVTPVARSLYDQVPTSGFGSARFKPSTSYIREMASADSVRIVRNVDTCPMHKY